LSLAGVVIASSWAHGMLMWSATRTPSHGTAGCGGRQRSAPSGGAAKGMPRNRREPPSISPWTSPSASAMRVPCWIGTLVAVAVGVVVGVLVTGGSVAVTVGGAVAVAVGTRVAVEVGTVVAVDVGAAVVVAVATAVAVAVRAVPPSSSEPQPRRTGRRRRAARSFLGAIPW
jgi:hypothetical protein